MRRHEITRRLFAKQLIQLFAVGGFSHFSLSRNAVGDMVSATINTNCPGGFPSADICNPPEDPDSCPGEKPPADECPDEGTRPEDVCNSGITVADTCEPQIEKTDQCESSKPQDDECGEVNLPEEDICPSGKTEDDFCPPGGSTTQGDVCPGGGDELDDCTGGGIPDFCSEGTWGPEDDCHEGWEDECASRTAPLDDDSCPNEKNVPPSLGPNGHDDLCFGNVIASDACSTGYPADDLCNSDSSTDGGFDTCPGGGINVDTCGIVYCDEYGHVERSDDYCVAGTGSDECPDGMPPEDECAGGVPAEDLCYMHLTGSDECDPSISGSDQEGCKSDSDECSFFGLADACTWGLNKDIAE